MKSKRIISLALVFALLFTVSLHAFAYSENSDIRELDASAYSVEEVKMLDPYVSKDGEYFTFDADAALDDGFDSVLVQAVVERIAEINTRVQTGVAEIQDDLSITSEDGQGTAAYSGIMPAAAAGHAYNCGGGTNAGPYEYWWGVERWLCDCATKDMIYAVNANAIAWTAVAGITALTGVAMPAAIGATLGAAYWGLVSNSLSHANQGKGVIMEMTWVLVFQCNPQ